MAKEIKVPNVGESVTEVTLSRWLVEEGDYIEVDQEICELESDKATLELPAEVAGKIKFVAQEGDDLDVGAVVAEVDESAEKPASDNKEEKAEKEESKETEEAPKQEKPKEDSKEESYASGTPSPAAAKLMEENDVEADAIDGTGKDGRITKQDVQDYLKKQEETPAKKEKQEAPKEKPTAKEEAPKKEAPKFQFTDKEFSRETSRHPMSRLRRTISERLVSAKNDTAMLTTFNEVNMEPVMNLRKQYKEKFKEKHGVNLGFMSFFTRACTLAIQEFPNINAQIEDNEIIQHHYVDLGIAVSTDRGLIVPVIKNAESLSMAEIEARVMDVAIRGRDGKLDLDEMQGGTFTITNGGVFGSMLSTPILNAPQSAILGMHKIEERPIAVDGQVVIKPMMYVAVSYDHRIVDGKESVSFLVKVKEYLENPSWMLTGGNAERQLLDV